MLCALSNHHPITTSHTFPRSDKVLANPPLQNKKFTFTSTTFASTSSTTKKSVRFFCPIALYPCKLEKQHHLMSLHSKTLDVSTLTNRVFRYTNKLFVPTRDSKRGRYGVAKMQVVSSVIEPESWKQQFTFIATSHAI